MPIGPGAIGMLRRAAQDPFLSPLGTTLNQVSSLGAFVPGASTLFFSYDIYWTHKYGERVTADDPWGFGNSLEWATSCPPRHSFTSLPRIRSGRPAFDRHYPHVASGRTRIPSGSDSGH